MQVYNERDLGKALHENVDTIEIEGDLAKKVVKIKATGKAAWIIAIGCIGIAIPALMITVASMGTATPATAPIVVSSLAPAIGVLGTEAAFSIASIATGAALAAGGVGGAAAGIAAVNKLRKYKLEKNNSKVILMRK